MKTEDSKSDQLTVKIVSRKENEEVFYDKNGNLTTGNEEYDGSDDQQPFSGLESHVKTEVDLDSGQSVDAQHQGIED